MEEPSFWEDAERSTKIVKEAKNLKDTVEGYQHLERLYEEIELMIEMGYEETVMRFCVSTPEPAAQSPATGAVCCTGCTAGGQRAGDFL